MASTVEQSTIPLVAALRKGNYLCARCGVAVPLNAAAALVTAPCPGCKHNNLVPRKISKFWLIKLLRDDDTAKQYLARHEDMPLESFCVKLLSDDLPNIAEAVSQFSTEATMLRQLGDHPALLKCVELGCIQGVHYIAIDYHDGERLDDRVARQGPYHEGVALLVTLRLLAAAAHMYQRGYLFRDFDPRNILVTDKHGPYVFAYDACTPIDDAQSGATTFGSPLFMSPEQLTGLAETIPSAIYSLGMCLYYCLTGNTYFHDDDIPTLQQRYIENTLSLNDMNQKLKHLPSDAGAIVAGMINRQLKNRYQRFADVETDCLNVLLKHI